MSTSKSTAYLATLNDRELKAYHIAKDHLGMSFTMERSNGFRQWKLSQDTPQQKIVCDEKTSSQN